VAAAGRSAQGLGKRNGTTEGVVPHDRRQIEALPAVGQYVASAVLLFAHGRPEPLLDANMARVLERVFEPPIARRTKAEHGATILLPNSVATLGTKPHVDGQPRQNVLRKQ
jgi:adenine-specific DNA glycosylase